MSALMNLPDEALKLKDCFGVFDDFQHYTTAENFTTVVSDSGTVAHGDAVGGVVTLTPSDGSVGDNDEAYLKGTAEIFKFAANKPIHFETRIKFVEANTDDANIIAGLKDAVAADSILNDGGGPAASYSGCVFFKVDGGTKWQVESSLAGTQITSTTNVTAGGSSYQKLRIEAIPVSSTVVEITYYIDDVQCVDNTTGLPIKHQLTYTNATEMQVCLGVKNGDTNLETLLVDYVAAYQKR